MSVYVLIHIDCELFEGYSLFYLNGINCAESIAVQLIHSASGDKKQKITLEWSDGGTICCAVSQSAVVRARVFASSETQYLCELLADAFGLNEWCDEYENENEKGRRQRMLILSLLKGPKYIRQVNELLMKRWVFADTLKDQ